MKHVAKFAAVAIAVTIGAGVALAETSAENAIKYRKNVMKSVGGNTGAIVAILKGEVEDKDGVAIKAHARSLAAATSVVGWAFMTNAPGDGSKGAATAKVWSDWADFEKRANGLAEGAAAFAAKAEAGPVTMEDAKAFLTCKGCHDNFRSE